MSDNERPAAPGAVRYDIWAVSEKDYKSGNFDDAVYEAFKFVEALIQERIGSTNIGATLIDDAFANRKVLLPGNHMDYESLISFFKGAIGYYRGDRAHGTAPSLPIRTPEKCTRVLATASAMLDLLDSDENVAPRVLSDRTTSTSVEIVCQNLTRTTICLIDGKPAQIASSTTNALSLSAHRLDRGAHTVQLVDGDRDSRPYEIFVPGPDPGEPGAKNWYRVVTADLDVYANSDMVEKLPVKAVLIESYEGAGHRGKRCFPTSGTYRPGDYLSWEWDSALQAVGEGWVQIPGESAPIAAWTGSVLFAGRVLGAAGTTQLLRLSVSNGDAITVPKGSTLPIVVVATWSDGPAEWIERLRVGECTISSDHPDVAHVASDGVCYAKDFGQARVTIEYRGKHASLTIEVASDASGASYAVVGGYSQASGVAMTLDGIVIANRSNELTRLSKGRLNVVGRLHETTLTGLGLDNICSDAEGNIWARHHGAGFELVAFDGPAYGKVTSIPLPAGCNPMGLASFRDGIVISALGGALWTTAKDRSAAERLIQIFEPEERTRVLLHVAASDDVVYVTDNSGFLYKVDPAGPSVKRIELQKGGTLSSIGIHDGKLYGTDFHGGSLVAINDDGTTRDIASGLGLPVALTFDDEGHALTADLEGGRIFRTTI